MLIARSADSENLFFFKFDSDGHVYICLYAENTHKF